MIKPSETSDILQQQLDNVDLKAEFEEIGTVLEVGDGVANVFGLEVVPVLGRYGLQYFSVSYAVVWYD